MQQENAWPRRLWRNTPNAISIARLCATGVLLLAGRAWAHPLPLWQSVRDFDGTGVVVVLNRFDEGNDLHRRNLEWLSGIDALDVVTDVDAVVGVLLDALPTFCPWCGRLAT